MAMTMEGCGNLSPLPPSPIPGGSALADSLRSVIAYPVSNLIGCRSKRFLLSGRIILSSAISKRAKVQILTIFQPRRSLTKVMAY